MFSSLRASSTFTKALEFLLNHANDFGCGGADKTSCQLWCASCRCPQLEGANPLSEVQETSRQGWIQGRGQKPGSPRPQAVPGDQGTVLPLKTCAQDLTLSGLCHPQTCWIEPLKRGSSTPKFSFPRRFLQSGVCPPKSDQLGYSSLSQG